MDDEEQSDVATDEDDYDEPHSLGMLLRMLAGRFRRGSNPDTEQASQSAQPVRPAEEAGQADRMKGSLYEYSVKSHRGGVVKGGNLAKWLEKRSICGPSAVSWPAMASKFVPNTPLQRIVSPREQRLYSGQYSGSGQLFVSSGQDTNIVLYDAGGDWSVHKTIEARDVQWTISSTDVSPDERFMTYTSLMPVVHLCNVFGEYEQHDSLDMREVDRAGFAVWCAKFSPGGSELLAGCGNNKVMLYDIERKRLVGAASAHRDDINSVCYADAVYQPNVIASASDDSFLKIWDRRTMRMTSESRGRLSEACGVLPGHCEGITHVTSKGDGVYLLTNGKDQTAKLWDIRKMVSPSSGQAVASGMSSTFDYRFMAYPRLHRPPRHPHDQSVMTYRGHSVLQTLIRCYFSQSTATSQQYFVTGSADGSVYVYDVLTGVVVNKLTGHEATVRDVSWHPSIPVVASSSWDGSIMLWKPNTAVCDSGKGSSSDDE